MKNKLNLIVISCLAMVLARMLYAENIKLIFLIWNLFLAWIPFYTSTKLLDMNSRNKFKFYTILTICILFLPNAIYLVTDLIHLKPRLGVPFWYDVVILFSFSVMGLIYSTASFIHLERILRNIMKQKWALISLFVLALISGYGVYMGRVLRWNSWDALVNPLSVALDCGHKLLNPLEYPDAYGFTIVYGAIQFLFWYVFREGINGIKLISNEG
jgi:uncharacterized membrane protein